MKAVFVYILVSWVAGIAIGVAGASVVFASGLAALAAALARRRYAAPTATAVGIVLALGAIYGAAGERTLTVCNPPDAVEGVVTAVNKLEPDRAQYVFESDRGCVLLVYAPRFPVYQAGTRAVVRGNAQPVTDIPDEYAGYRAYLTRRGIGGTVRYAQIAVEEEARGTLSNVRSGVRRRIGSVFAAPEANILSAMITGVRGQVPEPLTQQLRAAGVGHILAISGLHVSFAAALALMFAQFLPLPPLARSAVAVSLAWAYIVFAGAPVSAVRAGVFWTIAIFAYRLRALVSLPTALVLALTGIVSIDPPIMREVSFQLSFGAVAGIGLALFAARPVRWLARGPAAGAVVSLGALSGTAPVAAYHFGAVSLAGLAANVLVVPTIPVMFVGALLALVVSAIAPPLALLLAGIVHFVWIWIDSITGAAAALPGGYITDISLPPWGVAAIYAGFVAVVTFIIRRQGRSWREVWV